MPQDGAEYLPRTTSTNIIFGLGSGRCGTKSLASLISMQEGAVCFHELNPSSMSWDNGFATVKNTYRNFFDLIHSGDPLISFDQSMGSSHAEFEKINEGRIKIAGDVASYYLPYVEYILELDPSVKFPCLKREKQETVRSFIKKTRRHNNFALHAVNAVTYFLFSKHLVPAHRNHWVEHDGSIWKQSTVWDKCFPKFETSDLQEAISLYWESYYERIEELSEKYSDNVKVFDMRALSEKSVQFELLDFCGIQNPRTTVVHENF